MTTLTDENRLLLDSHCPIPPFCNQTITGGVQILTGCSFNYFSATQMFSGSGEFAVFGGK